MTGMPKPLWLALLLLACLTGCGGTENGDSAPVAESGLTVMELTVGDRTVAAEIADTPDSRARGLMYRDSLAPDHGMLFVYPSPRNISFWMKNTEIPLDIAFIREDGTIVGITAMAPQSLRSHYSPSRVPYALEMEQGWFREHGIEVGDTVSGLPAMGSAE